MVSWPALNPQLLILSSVGIADESVDLRSPLVGHPPSNLVYEKVFDVFSDPQGITAGRVSEDG